MQKQKTASTSEKASAALLRSAWRGDAPQVAALLRAGADVSVVGGGGQTALHLACSEGHIEAVHVLLKAGAALEGGDNEGRTALMHAVIKSRLPVMRMLLVAGAGVNVPDRQGRTAIGLAHEQTSDALAAWRTLPSEQTASPALSIMDAARTAAGKAKMALEVQEAMVQAKLDRENMRMAWALQRVRDAEASEQGSRAARDALIALHSAMADGDPVVIGRVLEERRQHILRVA